MTAPSSAGYDGLRVLVTGAAGAIGCNLTQALACAGAREVLAVDDLSQGVRWNVPERPNVTFVEGSILDDEVVASIFQWRPAVIFHLAALFANQNSIERPVLDLHVNGEGTLRLLMGAVAAGRPRFVFASTSAAAPNPPGGVIDDDASATRHGSPYQITKGLGEQYCRFYQAHHGLETVRVRFFNSYGPGELPGRYRNAIPNFFYLARRGEPLPIHGTGRQTRDWTFVRDIVDGLLLAGRYDKAVGQSVNLGTGRQTPVADIAHEINALTGNTAGLVHRQHRRWDKDLRRAAATQKAAHVLGHRSGTDVGTGLKHTAQWFCDNWAQIQADARF
jgi:nucleoside-diphosphate-sugar epimerase